MTQRRSSPGPIPFLRVPAFWLVLALILTGCPGGAGDPGRTGGELIPAVEAVRARHGSLPLSERLSGVVRARNQVELYPQISAPVVEVYVQNGDLVASGQPLVRLRDTEFREQLSQAEASHQIALAQARQAEAELLRVRAEFERSKTLAGKNLISPTELETAQANAIGAEADAELTRARVAQTRATVEERKEALSRTVIRAPVRGTLGNRNAEVGMLVTPGTRLFVLGQLDSVRVEVMLTDRMLSYIQEGQRSAILAPGIRFGSTEAPVSRISPFLHPVSHSTTAEIDLANPDGALRPGMFVTVDIFYGESEEATLIPLCALWESPATTTVGAYVTSDSLSREPAAVLDPPEGGALTDPVSFRFVPVTVIARGRMDAAVTGIDPGSWIVTIGQDLFGADSGLARVRPVDWDWVEELQHLQREDLLQEIMQRQQEGATDTVPVGRLPAAREDAA